MTIAVHIRRCIASCLFISMSSPVFSFDIPTAIQGFEIANQAEQKRHTADQYFYNLRLKIDFPNGAPLFFRESAIKKAMVDKFSEVPKESFSLVGRYEFTPAHDITVDNKNYKETWVAQRNLSLKDGPMAWVYRYLMSCDDKTIASVGVMYFQDNAMTGEPSKVFDSILVSEDKYGYGWNVYDYICKNRTPM